MLYMLQTQSVRAGEYHGKTVHMPDLDQVLERAWKSGGCKKAVPGCHLSTWMALYLGRSIDH